MMARDGAFAFLGMVLAAIVGWFARSRRATVGRAEFDQLAQFARDSMTLTLDLDARVRVLEGKPPRPALLDGSEDA